MLDVLDNEITEGPAFYLNVCSNSVSVEPVYITGFTKKQVKYIGRWGGFFRKIWTGSKSTVDKTKVSYGSNTTPTRILQAKDKAHEELLKGYQAEEYKEFLQFLEENNND